MKFVLYYDIIQIFSLVLHFLVNLNFHLKLYLQQIAYKSLVEQFSLYFNVISLVRETQ